MVGLYGAGYDGWNGNIPSLSLSLSLSIYLPLAREYRKARDGQTFEAASLKY
jgi:hypothetical protein